MSSENSGDNLPAALLKSKAGEKLADTIRNVVDYTFGPKRIASVARARADAAVVAARAEAEVDEIRAAAAERILDREIRNQRNVEEITHEAFKALPPPEVTVASEPVSEDFVYRFFEECEGVGDEQMQRLWGKLLAGEVVRPGSFHPRTLRILKDLTTEDANSFAAVCRFGLFLAGFTLLVFDTQGKPYNEHGVNFNSINHLHALGLLSTSGTSGFARMMGTGSRFAVRYGDEIALIEPTARGELPVGKVLLTEAGAQLANLFDHPPVPGFAEYLFANWKRMGVAVTDQPA